MRAGLAGQAALPGTAHNFLRSPPDQALMSFKMRTLAPLQNGAKLAGFLTFMPTANMRYGLREVVESGRAATVMNDPILRRTS